MRGLSQRATPLIDSTKKGVFEWMQVANGAFEWMQVAQEAFECLEKVITN